LYRLRQFERAYGLYEALGSLEGASKDGDSCEWIEYREPALSHSLLQKSPKFYPAEDEPKTKKVYKVVQNPPRVRPSIAPGVVLILLAGRFRGKRVVCLNVLPSGLALVSGPYSVNGVPLRRVNPAYVIATSLKIDVSGIDVSKFNDAYFARSKDEPVREFFDTDAPKPAVVSDERKADQQTVDTPLLKAIEAVDDMCKGYLAAKFSLSASDKPHLMKF